MQAEAVVFHFAAYKNVDECCEGRVGRLGRRWLTSIGWGIVSKRWGLGSIGGDGSAGKIFGRKNAAGEISLLEKSNFAHYCTTDKRFLSLATAAVQATA